MLAEGAFHGHLSHKINYLFIEDLIKRSDLNVHCSLNNAF